MVLGNCHRSDHGRRSVSTIVKIVLSRPSIIAKLPLHSTTTPDSFDPLLSGQNKGSKKRKNKGCTAEAALTLC
jgi:hypothetical protein